MLGDLYPGRTITVRFRAVVAPSSFFSSGTSVLTNVAFGRGSNTAEVNDAAFVSVLSVPQNPTVSFGKLGRNVTRGEVSEHSPVQAIPTETIEFILRVRNTSNAPISDIVVRDSVPQGIIFIAGSVRIDGAIAPDTLTSAGINIGALAVNQERAVVFSGRIVAGTQLPAGVTNILNIAQVSAPSMTMLTAQLPIMITNNAAIVAAVSTGPGESTVLALIISGIITLLYVGYTGTDTYRRREVKSIAKETQKDPTSFNFRR